MWGRKFLGYSKPTLSFFFTRTGLCSFFRTLSSGLARKGVTRLDNGSEGGAKNGMMSACKSHAQTQAAAGATVYNYRGIGMRLAKTEATVPNHLFEIRLELKFYCLDMRVCTVDHLIKVHQSKSSTVRIRIPFTNKLGQVELSQASVFVFPLP